MSLAAVDVAVLVMAAAAWAAGSTLARRSATASLTMATTSHLVAGGALLMVAAIVSGERVLDLPPVTMRSIAALAYLGVGTSAVTFAAYAWLLRRR